MGFSALLTDEGASEVGAPPSFFANNPPNASKGFHLSSLLYVAVNSLSCFSEKIWGAEVIVGLPPSLKSYKRRGAESG